MRKRTALFLVAAALLANLPAIAARNNILLIIADDYGTDSSPLFNTNSQASLAPTTHINSLYDSGVLFRSAYAYPTCSPSRACMLTGRYGFRTGIGCAIMGESDSLALLGNEPTIPKILDRVPGYRHANIGKWHLGLKPSDPNVLGGWSHFSGSLLGTLESYSRWSKTVNGVTRSTTNYPTSDNINDAIAWIQQQGTNNWFLWLAFNAPHDPFHKPPNDLHSYDGLSTSQTAISQNPRPYYQAMVEAMDTELGRLLSHVDRSNTTIIFVGDNGTPSEVVHPPVTSNRAKFTLYEGGIRVPMIIAGPVVRNPRRENTNLVHVVDLFATILELAGVDIRTELNTNMPSDSRSLLPILTDSGTVPRDWLISEQFHPAIGPANTGRAIRDEAFKLIRLKDGFQGFYDLRADPYEQTNLFNRAPTLEQSNHLETLSAKLAELQNVPQITGFSYTTSGMSVFADYIQGVQFSLRKTDSLSSEWKAVPATVRRTNFTVTLTDLAATNTASYYRVVAPLR